ncbi:MAG: hypothetical protein KBF56_10220 [Gemmatimonadaceae bacterium]|nr:hypothetical protein [Gemmatimonadaceae bacterium]
MDARTEGPARRLIVAVASPEPADTLTKADLFAHKRALCVELENVEAMLRGRPHAERAGLALHECHTIIQRKDRLVAAIRECKARLKAIHIEEDGRAAEAKASIVARAGDPALYVPVLIIRDLLEIIGRRQGEVLALSAEEARKLSGAGRWLASHYDAQSEVPRG